MTLTMPTATYPEEPKAKRQALLAAVENLRGVIESGVEEAERISTLPQATVDAIHAAGLFAYKSARVLGGAEADAMTQLDVVEAASRIDAAAGWCIMIGSGTLSGMTAFLPEKAINEVFVDGKFPRAAGAAAASGKAIPVDGGYQVTGRWAFGSGIRHSHYLAMGAMTEDGKSAPKQIRVVVPTSQATIHDNWDVVGLRGSGSNDFSLDNVFVPEHFTWGGHESKPLRGGPNFYLGRPGMQVTGHCGVALGIARRALDEITELAKTKKRGYRGTEALIADRGSFQRFLGESDARLRAAKALCVAVLEEAWNLVTEEVMPPPELQVRMRSASTYATEEASDIVSQAFRFGGGSAMHSNHSLQKCLRDVHAAAQHNMVSDRTYENHGQFMLGFPEANPMG
ncbi:MAG: acyl-CoA dehydrogenase family protein [Chloroflexota bacterium]|nr:acyl-CoA dehydrogenase family protein [Chloroflexota bacterium]